MTIPNPYPGPRPLTRDDRIYGRTVELRRLTNLLVGERIVLLYSPSGAGKTSLLQAGLLPRFDRAGYRVLGPIRPGVALGVDEHRVENRYVAATVDALRDQLGLPLELPPGATLVDCFTALGPPPPKLFRLGAQIEVDEDAAAKPAQPASHQKMWQADLLVFDQFEEVLLADPADHGGRLAFFEQLGEVLRDRNRWALFSMREEHIAGLDPYRRPIPSQLRTTFRLDLLDVPQAIEAIRGPAERAGVAFPEEIARGLARDLAGGRNEPPANPAAAASTQDAGTAGSEPFEGGQPARAPGRWVEPVQLQVVCQRIWEQLEPGETAISDRHLAEIGSVDAALRQYYADSVKEAAEKSGLRERKLREWIQGELITESGARNQFLWEKGPETTALDGAIDRLDKAHLIRAESRRDVLWIELAHDRLVKPVLEDNAAWFDQALQPFQKRAQAWGRSGQADLLLSGKALAEAEAWAKQPGNRAELDEHPSEAEFLDRSRTAEQERDRARRQRRAIAAASAVAALALVAGLVYAFVQADRSSRQEMSRRLGFDAVAIRVEQPSLALLLAANAYRTWDTFEARSSLVAALSPEGQPSGEFDTAGATTGAVAVNANAGDLAGLGGGVADLTSVTVSPDLRWLASGSRNGVVYQWERAKKGPPGTFALPNGAAVEHLAYSPDGRYIAAGDDAGMVWLFGGGSGALDLLSSYQAEPDRTNGLAWGQADALYTLGKNDVAQWRVSDGKAIEVARRPAQQARALAVSPAHDLLAIAYEDGSIAEWLLDARGTLTAAPAEHLEGYPNTPTSVAISETGEIAVGYESGLVVRWPAAGSKSRALRFAGSMDNAVTGLAWGPQAGWLASSGLDHEVVIWDTKAGGVRDRWRGHSDAVEAITVAPNGGPCFTAGADGRVLEWPEPGATHVGPFVRQAQGHSDEIWSVAFSPAQGAPALAATGGKDGQVRLWTITNANIDSKVVLQEDAGVRRVAFSDDGNWLAAGDETGRVMLWQIKDGAALEPHATYKHGDGFINGLVITPDALVSAGPVDPSMLGNQLKAWPLTAAGAALLGVSDPISPVMSMKKDAQDGIWVLTQDGKLITGRWSASSKAFVKNRDLDVAPRDGSAATSLAILKAGDQIALGMSNGRLALIAPGARTTVGQRVSFDANSKNLSALAFSPDGKLLASAGWDGQIMLWDVETRRRLGEPLSTGDLAISDIAFSSDGRWLAVASDNRTFMLYGATPEQWVRAACQTAGRALTEEERDRYLDGRGGQACPP